MRLVSEAYKRCSCCAREISAEQWAGLHWLGVMDDTRQHHDGECLELRQCTCGTTLARRVREEEPHG